MPRKPAYPIDPLFIKRWSPRAMSGESISHEKLMSLFEAARWAPSSFNSQPWYFIYALRNTPHWDRLFNLLVPVNQEWATYAAALLVIVSHNTFDNGTPNPTHSFCTGAAWENLALQGTIMNLVIHGMAGLDYDRARIELTIPDGYTVEAMAAIGRPGPLENLSVENQKREFPSDRKPVQTFIREGIFTV